MNKKACSHLSWLADLKAKFVIEFYIDNIPYSAVCHALKVSNPSHRLSIEKISPNRTKISLTLDFSNNEGRIRRKACICCENLISEVVNSTGDFYLSSGSLDTIYGADLQSGLSEIKNFVRLCHQIAAGTYP